MRTFAFCSESIFTLWQAATHRSDWKPIIYPWIQLGENIIHPCMHTAGPSSWEKTIVSDFPFTSKKTLSLPYSQIFQTSIRKKSLAQRKHAFTFRYRLAEEIDKKEWTGLEPEKQYWYWKPKRLFKDTVHFFFFTCSPGRFWWCFPPQCWNRK